MKVTIITPTYNSAETLRENLLSVRNQSYPNIEHLIIDNMSSDRTMDIIKEFGDNVRVCSESDRGIYDAMNKGIKMATGDIIGILNSDDYLSDRHIIDRIVSTFLRDDSDAVYGNIIYVKKEEPHKIHRIWEAGSYNPLKLLHGWMLPHPTLYLKKSVYEKYGLYKSDFRYSADYEMIIRLLLKFKIKASNLKKVVVYMRTGGASNKNLLRRLDVNKEDHNAWESIGIRPKWYTLYLKPLRKIFQYFHKYFSVKWLIHVPPACSEDSYINSAAYSIVEHKNKFARTRIIEEKSPVMSDSYMAEAV